MLAPMAFGAGQPSPFTNQFSGQPQFQTLGTLTGQQQGVANGLQQQIGQGRTLGQSPQVQNALSSALSSNPSAGLSPTATANYINQSVATPLLRTFDTSIMPRLNDAYASVGALMSSRRGFAGAQALKDLQNTIGTQLGQAQLSNQQLSANLQNEQANRQGQLAQGQQQLGLGYGQLGLGFTGQADMAIQPYRDYSALLRQGLNNPSYGQYGQQPNQSAPGFSSGDLQGLSDFQNQNSGGINGGGGLSDYLDQLLNGGFGDDSSGGGAGQLDYGDFANTDSGLS